jgi:hypothetical protein
MMSMSMTPREGHPKLVSPLLRADFPGLSTNDDYNKSSGII